ncbi:MAG: hypothetical protein AAF871_02965 [Pseudomonadota bacterium]
MSDTPASRSGRPLGFLSDLPLVEASAIAALRDWNGAALDAGAAGAAANEAAWSFETLAALCTLHGRRPLARRESGDPYYCSDEAAFAQLVASASACDREDAMMIAFTIVRADMAPVAVGLAEQAGLRFRRIAPPMLCQADGETAQPLH